MTIVRPLVTNSKMTLLFLQGDLSLPLSKRALVRWLSVREVRLWTGVCPPSLVTSLRNKTNFLFHQPCLFIGFWGGSTWICREPVWRIPPMAKVMRKRPDRAKARSGLEEPLPPRLSRASTPKPGSVCLIVLCLLPTLLTLTGGYPLPPFSGKS